MRPLNLAVAIAVATVSWSARAASAPSLPAEGFAAAPARSAARSLESDWRSEAYRLWQASGFGLDRSERAAWVVALPGGIAWRRWRWDRRDLESRWTGSVPRGAIAIVHTHPAVVDPRPSRQDCATAAQFGVAVYTISRSGIWRAEVDGSVTRVGDERWWVGCRAGRACREGVSVPLALANARTRGEDETAAGRLRITE